MSRVIENPTQLILDTARNILFTKGYSELSMRNIAKECGIALGTIYNYFPTKSDLIVEMMSVYWREYLDILEKLFSEDSEPFTKLHKVFNTLREFIKTFRAVWLKPELYHTPGNIESGLERQTIYMDRLIKRLEEFLVYESSKKHPAIKLKLDSYETAKFIVLNFITIIQMPYFEYKSFEGFLKELLQ
ncbi:MAG: transcriptional regulator [Clostridia bacterium]|jgi:AcrR family transcriptional regulator|nr:transcriptional regulator [Clostridia bacterium]